MAFTGSGKGKGIIHVVTVPFAEVAGTALDRWVFVAPCAARLIAGSEIHVAAGNDAGAVTLDVKKLRVGAAAAAPSTGIAMCTAFNLKSTANTTVALAPASSETTIDGVAVSDAVLQKGDRVGIDITGTPTTLVGGALTLVFELDPDQII